MPVYNRGGGGIKQPASTPATSGRVTHMCAIDSQPIRKFFANYTNAYETSQGHRLYVHVWTLFRVKDGLHCQLYVFTFWFCTSQGVSVKL